MLLPRLCFSGTCCSCHHNWGFYYAWEGIIRPDNQDVVRINLLLNRASQWLDVDSFLPYEGRVVIHNKSARTVFLRIPAWVDKKDVTCRHNDKTVDLIWIGNYLIVSGLAPKDKITAEFPMIEHTEKYHGYTIVFKGNTVVDIHPREHKDDVHNDQGEFPIYLRDHLKKNKAPMKQVTRYVSPMQIKW